MEFVFQGAWQQSSTHSMKLCKQMDHLYLWATSMDDIIMKISINNQSKEWLAATVNQHLVHKPHYIRP